MIDQQRLLSNRHRIKKLATGVDNVTGTTGNGTIVAANVLDISSDNSVATLSALDNIDGASGIDTTKVTDDTSDWPTCSKQ